MEEINETINAEELVSETQEFVAPKEDRKVKVKTKKVEQRGDDDDELINCLINERNTVRYLPNEKK